MELFRWILIIAGVGILALLYFSGRPRRSDTQRDAVRHARESDAKRYAADDDLYLQADDELIQPNSVSDPYPNQELSNSEPGDGYGYEDDYGYGDEHDNGGYAGGDLGDPLLNDPNDPFDDLAGIKADDLSRPASADLPREFTEPSSSKVRSTIAQKIESFSNRLSPRRSQRVAEISAPDSPSEVKPSSGNKSKIVTIHIVAPQDQVFNGATLYELFEQRGLHFGEMNIFHSMHQQKKMFSIVKMVEPGYFDIDDINSFYTPGITLILQLPGPVAADVAFEVLISEASEIAQHLGGVVLGSDRSTLSNQAVAHMREDILEYMHRQRYFSHAVS